MRRIDASRLLAEKAIERVEVVLHVAFGRIDDHRPDARDQVARDHGAAPLLDHAEVAARMSGEVERAPPAGAYLEAGAVLDHAIDREVDALRSLSRRRDGKPELLRAAGVIEVMVRQQHPDLLAALLRELVERLLQDRLL